MAARLGTEGSACKETADGPLPELRDALRDLDEATAEAREEGFPLPSDTALTNARRLLPTMYELSPCRSEVYPYAGWRDRRSGVREFCLGLV